VKENIESGTNRRTAYAVELLDVFLSEQLKQRVIPFWTTDDYRKNQSTGGVLSTGEMEPSWSLIPDQQDFTQVNRWTKSWRCVPDRAMKLSFFPGLNRATFNPDV